MRLEKHNADEMTSLERIYAYEHGLSYDRIPSVPFIGNVRCKVGGMTPEEYWDSAENMVKAELMSYQRFGFDRLGIGPNTRGIRSLGKSMKLILQKEEFRKFFRPVRFCTNKENM